MLIIGLVGVLAQHINAQPADLMIQNARASYEKVAKMDLDGFSAYLATNCVDYQGSVPIKGKEAVKNSLKEFLRAFPGYTLEIHDVAVSGNKAYISNTFTGTQTAPLADLPPTGRKGVWKDVDILEFDKDGKIAAHWTNNSSTLLDQLGFHAFNEPTTALIMQAYQKFGKGDIPGVLDYCADNIRWDVLDNTAPEIANVYKGKAEVKNFFDLLFKTLTITSFEPYRFFADGDEVTVLVKSRYMRISDQKSFENMLIHHFVIRDNKVVSFKEVQDRPIESSIAQK